MISEVWIRLGRAGTLETLQIINDVGQRGAPMVPFLLLSVPVELWQGIFRKHWLYDLRRSVNGKQAQQFLKSIDVQIYSYQTKGYMSGDCAEAAAVLVAVATAGRLPYEIVAVRRPDEMEFSHVFVEVEGIQIDPTSIWIQTAPGKFEIDPEAPTDRDYRRWERMVYP